MKTKLKTRRELRQEARRRMMLGEIISLRKQMEADAAQLHAMFKDLRHGIQRLRDCAKGQPSILRAS